MSDTTGPFGPAGPTTPDGWVFGRHDRCCAAADRPLQEPSGSRRRRLWELGAHAHCPVIGVCLPLPAIRRLAQKVLASEPVADDYELHCGMVADCKRRTPMAEAVQRELDRRFMLPLRRASTAKTVAALASWWQEQSAFKDLPGALWATLTHARCTAALEYHVLGQVHMIQHQVGMASRVELARFEALIDENAVLARELGGAQQRSALQASVHAERAEALQSEVVRLRGQAIAAQSVAASLRQDLHDLRATMPDLDKRQALIARNAQQEERMHVVLRAMQQARSEVDQLREQLREQQVDQQHEQPQADTAPALPVAAVAPTRNLPASSSKAAAAADMALAHRAVLCVGGRTSSVPIYRRLIESQGARFLHHDGGAEHSAGQLESTLAAADLVICQTGCVSHNAYWRVKDHCKRTGKRCVFVDTPSATSLQRALADIGAGP